MPDSLGVVAGIEGSLEDPSRKDDPVLGGQVIGIDSLWGHAPPGQGGGTGHRQGCVPVTPAPAPSCATAHRRALPKADTFAPVPLPRTLPGDKPQLPQVTCATTGDLLCCATHEGDLLPTEPAPSRHPGSHPPLLPPKPTPYWSRLGGFRSWSAITLAEKL